MKIAFWKHYPQIDQNGQMLGRAAIDYQRRFGFDFVKITPAGTWLAVCYGAVDECKKDHLGRRGVIKSCITNWKDWGELPLFDRNFQPEMLKQQLIASQLVCNEIDDADVYATLFSPLSQAIQIAGLDVFKQHIDLYPEEVEKGLRRITSNTCYVMSQFADTGVKGMFYVMQHVQENLFSASDYQRYAQHHDSNALKHAASLFTDTLVHLHGENIYWGLSSPIPGVRIHFGIHPANPSVAAMHEASQLPIVAGLPVDDLIRTNSDAEARQLLYKHFSDEADLSTSLVTCECVLPLDFPDEKTDFWIQFLETL